MSRIFKTSKLNKTKQTNKQIYLNLIKLKQGNLNLTNFDKQKQKIFLVFKMRFNIDKRNLILHAKGPLKYHLSLVLGIFDPLPPFRELK